MLKHRLKEPFGKAGLTVAICALVLALVGGAYAAGGLTKSQEKQVTKIAKKYAGKPGPAGPAGAAGTAGTNGTNGAAGKNGTNGTNGKEGSPWTAGGTLPSGSTEAGTWAAQPEVVPGTGGISFGNAPISFTIPLAQTPTVELEPEGYTGALGANCPGSAAEPGAKAGFLCVYTTSAAFGSGITLSTETVGKTGDILAFKATNAGELIAGTWAVTAE
jgi:hypothetical protein